MSMLTPTVSGQSGNKSNLTPYDFVDVIRKCLRFNFWEPPKHKREETFNSLLAIAKNTNIDSDTRTKAFLAITKMTEQDQKDKKMAYEVLLASEKLNILSQPKEINVTIKKDQAHEPADELAIFDQVIQTNDPEFPPSSQNREQGSGSNPLSSQLIPISNLGGDSQSSESEETDQDHHSQSSSIG